LIKGESDAALSRAFHEIEALAGSFQQNFSQGDERLPPRIEMIGAGRRAVLELS
jgi:hypothetical protein